MIKEQALAALGDLGQVVLVDLLVFRRQRRLLALGERLARIEPQLLARQPREVGGPFALPARIFVLRARAVRRRRQDGRQCQYLKAASTPHAHPPWLVGSSAR